MKKKPKAPKKTKPGAAPISPRLFRNGWAYTITYHSPGKTRFWHGNAGELLDAQLRAKALIAENEKLKAALEGLHFHHKIFEPLCRHCQQDPALARQRWRVARRQAALKAEC